LSARAIDRERRSEDDKEREEGSRKKATSRPKPDNKAHGQFAPVNGINVTIGAMLINTRSGGVVRSEDTAGIIENNYEPRPALRLGHAGDQLGRNRPLRPEICREYGLTLPALLVMAIAFLSLWQRLL
jgi:hypothetical protein